MGGQQLKPSSGSVLKNESKNGVELRNLLYTRNKPLEELLKKSEQDMGSFLKGITNRDIGFLVEEGYKLDSVTKLQVKNIDKIKDILKGLSETTGQREFKGTHSGTVKISDKKEKFIDPEEFLKYLRKIEKPKLFMSFIKVKISDTVKSFGIESLGKAITTTTKEFYTCAFKK